MSWKTNWKEWDQLESPCGESWGIREEGGRGRGSERHWGLATRGWREEETVRGVFGSGFPPPGRWRLIPVMEQRRRLHGKMSPVRPSQLGCLQACAWHCLEGGESTDQQLRRCRVAVRIWRPWCRREGWHPGRKLAGWVQSWEDPGKASREGATGLPWG